MSLNKNKSEIVKSFKNLLKKADELAQEKKTDILLNKNKVGNIFENNKTSLLNSLEDQKFISQSKKDRLGIKNIKRVPSNPYRKRYHKKNSDYVKIEKELSIKITNIFNKHIHYWLKRELPKYVRKKLKKHIYNILLKL